MIFYKYDIDQYHSELDTVYQSLPEFREFTGLQLYEPEQFDWTTQCFWHTKFPD